MTIERDERGYFKKGKSANPSGRPKGIAEMQAEFRKYSPESLKVLVSLLKSKSPHMRLGAAKEILDRGWGKAAQAIQLEHDGQISISVNVVEKCKKLK